MSDQGLSFLFWNQVVSSEEVLPVDLELSKMCLYECNTTKQDAHTKECGRAVITVFQNISTHALLNHI